MMNGSKTNRIRTATDAAPGSVNEDGTINIRLNTANGSDKTTALTVEAAITAIQKNLEAATHPGLFSLVEDLLFAGDMMGYERREQLFTAENVVRISIPKAMADEPLYAPLVDRLRGINNHIDFAVRMKARRA